MRKFLFSFVAVLAFAGLFGLQGALSSCGSGGGSFNCSGGGPFYGTNTNIDCWKSQLEQGVCGLTPCGTFFEFWSIDDDEPVPYTLTTNCVQ